MNKFTLAAMVCVLTACSKGAPTDTVDSLVSRPDRLREVEKACNDDYEKMGAAEYNAASDARHRLFMGNRSQYTPPKDPPKF